jgi:hypothetical protein
MHGRRLGWSLGRLTTRPWLLLKATTVADFLRPLFCEFDGVLEESKKLMGGSAGG